MFQYNKYKTKNGKFGCHKCKGKRIIVYTCDIKKRTREVTCGFCAGTGFLVVSLERELKEAEGKIKFLLKKIEGYKDFIKQNSNCKTCHGVQEKTPGGCPCKECGLIGQMPWGG